MTVWFEESTLSAVFRILLKYAYIIKLLYYIQIRVFRDKFWRSGGRKPSAVALLSNNSCFIIKQLNYIMKKITLGLVCYPGFEIDKMKQACIDNDVNYIEIDFLSTDWLNQCRNPQINGFIIRPPCTLQEHKNIFDERVYFINEILKKPTYPSFKELYIYENKRNMALYLEGIDAPHPETKVFLDKKSALQKTPHFPVVMKSNIGASGSAVKIIKNNYQYKKMIKKIFGYIHPEFSLGWIPFVKYKNIPFPRIGRSQKHYAILQEFLDIKWEWRMIRIGDSYLGHQKLLGDNGFASGSELVGWEEPSKELLLLLHNVTEKLNSRCMVLDIFETKEGKFFINEMQTIIGAYRPYQMKINNKPGRFILKENNFIFEEGIHFQNSCWNPRVEDFKKILLEEKRYE